MPSTRWTWMTVRFSLCWIVFCLGGGLIVGAIASHVAGLAWAGAVLLAAAIGGFAYTFSRGKRFSTDD